MRGNNIHFHGSFVKGSLIIEGLYRGKKPRWLVFIMSKEGCAVFSTRKPDTELAAVFPTTGPMVQEGAEIWRGFKERPQVMPDPEGEMQCGVACGLLHRTIFSISQTPNKIKRWEIEVRQILPKMKTVLQRDSH